MQNGSVNILGLSIYYMVASDCGKLKSNTAVRSRPKLPNRLS